MHRRWLTVKRINKQFWIIDPLLQNPQGSDFLDISPEPWIPQPKRRKSLKSSFSLTFFLSFSHDLSQIWSDDFHRCTKAFYKILRLFTQNVAKLFIDSNVFWIRWEHRRAINYAKQIIMKCEWSELRPSVSQNEKILKHLVPRFTHVVERHYASSNFHCEGTAGKKMLRILNFGFFFSFDALKGICSWIWIWFTVETRYWRYWFENEIRNFEQKFDVNLKCSF